MTVKPIIFSAPMIRALLAGSKTQTRRVLKLPTKTFSGGPIYERKDMGGWMATTSGGGGCFTLARDGSRIPAPERVAIWHQTTGACMETPYQPGDRLWVREGFALLPKSAYNLPKTIAQDPDNAAYYRADFDRSGKPAWKSSMFMPRWASRLTLAVTDVRVQRLQDISEADAIAEGVEPLHQGWYPYGISTFMTMMIGDREVPAQYCQNAVESYHRLWNTLHGPAAWDENPWVCALTFAVHRCNIDAMEVAI